MSQALIFKDDRDIVELRWNWGIGTQLALSRNRQGYGQDVVIFSMKEAKTLLVALQQAISDLEKKEVLNDK